MIELVAGSPDEALMDLALSLAREGWGQVSPNPLVGALVVSDGEVVGRGWHARFGHEHAEVVALRKAGGRARGATLYVSLEPCAHHGQTPPCTEAIQAAGIQRVVYACRDPDSRAEGGGRILADAGIEVTGGVRSLEAARLNAPFVWHRLRHGPWLTLKLGVSLDGRISERPGVRTQLTGEESARYVHRLRAGHDAIMVGGRTAIVDDPLLTVRLVPPPRVPPTRVILDPELDLGIGSRLVGSVGEAPILLLCGMDASADRRAALERRGVAVESVNSDASGLDLEQVVGLLGGKGIRSLLVEGGGRLAGELLAGGFVHCQHLIYAPVVLGPAGVPAYAHPSAKSEDGWKVVGIDALGQDTLLMLEDQRATDTLREVA